MKILAMEVEKEGVRAEDFAPHLKEEARRLWDLQQAGVVREAYFRADRRTAVLVLECEGLAQAQEALGELPLARRGLIRFDLVPLLPYSGYARLFE